MQGVAHKFTRCQVRRAAPPRSLPSSGSGLFGDAASWGVLLKGLQGPSHYNHRHFPAGYGYLPLKYPAARGKEFVIIRHGHSTWNQQSRIQGNSDQSELTDDGILQSMKCRDALQDLQLDSCFSSPITRARQSSEVICGERIPVTYMDSLQEAYLGWFQGLQNDDAARDFPEMYRVWREQPEEFCIDGRYPIVDVFHQAHMAWQEMMSAPGSRHLVITHKSILRALLCTALGLPPCQFRAFDAANGSISALRVMKSGQLMVVKLNVQGHLVKGDCSFVLPQASVVERKFSTPQPQPQAQPQPQPSPSGTPAVASSTTVPSTSAISALRY